MFFFKLIISLKSNIENPTYDVVFQPQYHIFYTSKPWKITKPTTNLSLTKHKKHLNDSFSSLCLFNEFNNVYSQYKAIYTDGSNHEDKVAAAVICSNFNLQIRLPDGASIYTAELQAIKVAFNFIIKDSNGVD